VGRRAPTPGPWSRELAGSALAALALAVTLAACGGSSSPPAPTCSDGVKNGSEIDVGDGAVIAAGYDAQLERAEFAPGGKFAALSRWLGRSINRYGFYRPYTRAGKGVQPEPWHLSYAPVARRALPMLTVDVLAAAIAGAGVEGETAILARLPSIHERYVMGVDAPPRMRSRWARLSSR